MSHTAYFNIKLKNLNLVIESLSKSSEQRRQKIAILEQKFELLLKKLNKYNFIKNISNSTQTLFVGEGNFSFSYSITKQLQNNNNIIASTNEIYSELSELAKTHVLKLKKLNIQTLFQVDATKLHKFFNNAKFDIIVFQFPNVASRESINGHNPNYILVKDFLISASKILTKNGKVVITIVDSDYYNNIFKLEEISKTVGLSPPMKYIFDPNDYPDYEHTMSHQNFSILDNYNKFTTYEFSL